MNYILFDLEAVGNNECDDFMEIIEIAAYKVTIKNHMKCYSEYMKKHFVPQCLIVDSYHSYVKPVFHQTLNKKISKLTNISFSDLLTADYYDTVIKNFIEWAFIDENTGEKTDAIFVSWSNSDKQMIEENNNSHFITNLPKLSYLDLQFEYDKIFRKGKRTSLTNAIKSIGNDFDGHCHSAQDDSFNMIPIMQTIINEKRCLNK